ncbi:[Pyruvate dehydrogenase (acetyl-transferring)] kinase [Venturia inaequalis]|nr:[Pyruvate dehydrogenase (acetyl-transferring)] kinase [Venturia inaequalis]
MAPNLCRGTAGAYLTCQPASLPACQSASLHRGTTTGGHPDLHTDTASCSPIRPTDARSNMTVDALNSSRNSGREITAAKVGLIGCADMAKPLLSRLDRLPPSM